MQFLSDGHFKISPWLLGVLLHATAAAGGNSAGFFNQGKASEKIYFVLNSSVASFTVGHTQA